MSDKDRPTNVDDEDDQPEPRKCQECGKKGKGVSLFRRRKGKKLHNSRKKQNPSPVNSGGCGRSRFCLCLKQPLTLDSSVSGSPTSDPNSPAFTFNMLRGLIEKNDFYSNECNPHLDA